MSLLSGDCNVCIKRKMPSYSATCVECGLSRKNYKTMTNADKIRAMTDKELAGVFDLLTRTKPETKDDKKLWLDWLKQEAE